MGGAELTCPKCGGEVLLVDVPRGGKAMWCSWCERMYYDPKMSEEELREAFMRQFGGKDDKA